MHSGEDRAPTKGLLNSTSALTLAEVCNVLRVATHVAFHLGVSDVERTFPVNPPKGLATPQKFS